MLWFFLLFSTGCWGLAEIFYKKGNVPNERYAHLKTTVFVGIFLGIYSLVIVLTQDVRIEYLPANIIRYLPVAACYIVSMVCSYYGVRYIEESISDPIENTSCAVVPVLCAVFLHQKLSINNPKFTGIFGNYNQSSFGEGIVPETTHESLRRMKLIGYSTFSFL